MRKDSRRDGTAHDDPEGVAEQAGLHYASDDRPGIGRRRAGGGFSYRAPDGETIRSARIRARIEALAVPPAWTDVWINPDPQGHPCGRCDACLLRRKGFAEAKLVDPISYRD